MDIRTKATDFTITPDISAYLDERIVAIGKLAGDKARLEVELGRDAGRPRHGKNIFFAEFIVIRAGEDRVCARNNSESINGAIDDAKDEMLRQLRSAKTSRKSVIRKAGALAKRMLRGE